MQREKKCDSHPNACTQRCLPTSTSSSHHPQIQPNPTHLNVQGIQAFSSQEAPSTQRTPATSLSYSLAHVLRALCTQSSSYVVHPRSCTLARPSLTPLYPHLRNLFCSHTPMYPCSLFRVRTLRGRGDHPHHMPGGCNGVSATTNLSQTCHIPERAGLAGFPNLCPIASTVCLRQGLRNSVPVHPACVCGS